MIIQLLHVFIEDFQATIYSNIVFKRSLETLRVPTTNGISIDLFYAYLPLPLGTEESNLSQGLL